MKFKIKDLVGALGAVGCTTVTDYWLCFTPTIMDRKFKAAHQANIAILKQQLRRALAQ